MDISQGGLEQILSQRRGSKSKSLMEQGKSSSLPGPGKQGSALQVSGSHLEELEGKMSARIPVLQERAEFKNGH